MAVPQKTSKRFVAGYFAAACLLMLFASLQPGAQGRVAVFAAPWSNSAPEIIALAGGRIVSTDSSGWIAVSELGSEGLLGRHYGSGAVFVASSLVAQACANLMQPYQEKNS